MFLSTTSMGDGRIDPTKPILGSISGAPMTRFCRGIRILVWSSVLSAATLHLVPASFPVFDLGMRALFCVGIGNALIVSLLPVGVFLTLSFDAAEEGTSRGLRHTGTVLALVYCTATWVYAFRLNSDTAAWAAVAVAWDIAETLGILVLFGYLSKVARRFDAKWLGGALAAAGIVYAFAVFAPRGYEILASSVEFSATPSETSVLFAGFGLRLVCGMMALTALLLIGRRIPVLVRGRCIACGYRAGIGESQRCPECGSSNVDRT